MQEGATATRIRGYKGAGHCVQLTEHSSKIERGRLTERRSPGPRRDRRCPTLQTYKTSLRMRVQAWTHLLSKFIYQQPPGPAAVSSAYLEQH